MYLLFVHSYVASKNRDKGEKGRESNDEIKEELSKSLTDREVEFKFGRCKKL